MIGIKEMCLHGLILNFLINSREFISFFVNKSEISFQKFTSKLISIKIDVEYDVFNKFSLYRVLFQTKNIIKTLNA